MQLYPHRVRVSGVGVHGYAVQPCCTRRVWRAARKAEHEQHLGSDGSAPSTSGNHHEPCIDMRLAHGQQTLVTRRHAVSAVAALASAGVLQAASPGPAHALKTVRRHGVAGTRPPACSLLHTRDLVGGVASCQGLKHSWRLEDATTALRLPAMCTHQHVSRSGARPHHAHHARRWHALLRTSQAGLLKLITLVPFNLTHVLHMTDHAEGRHSRGGVRTWHVTGHCVTPGLSAPAMDSGLQVSLGQVCWLYDGPTCAAR